MQTSFMNGSQDGGPNQTKNGKGNENADEFDLDDEYGSQGGHP